MKKSILAISLLTILALSLTACGKTDEKVHNCWDYEKVENQNIEGQLSEEEVRSLTAKIDTLLYSDILDPRKLDSNYITVNGMSYSTSPTIKTKEDFKSKLKDYYTDELIEKTVEKIILEKDGKFYLVYGQRGITPSIEKDKINYSQTKDTLSVKYIVYSDEEESNILAESTYEFKKINGKWLLNK